MTRLTLTATAAALVVGLTLAAEPATAFAGEDAIYTPRFSNVAVGGYDPVSFFSGEGVEGSKRFTAEHDGAEFRFASQENLDTFLGDPDAYAPQFGGYCAWAVAEGQLAPGDPNFASVVDGKLYLNFNAQVQNTWNGDRAGFIERAEANWPGILG